MNNPRHSSQAHLLRCHLAAFVPLMIQELGQRALVLPRHDLAGIIAAHGDATTVHRIPGQTARAVSALVEALAVLAFCPGGVTLAYLDLHFEVPPRQAMAVLEAQGLLQPRPAPAPTTPPGPKPVAPAGTAEPRPTFKTMFRRPPGFSGSGPGRDSDGQA